ncbi:CPCC family cysteine-rich protein [Ruminococcus sp.]|jgi:hypothetical protein|uniref:CPCC family cysteine-rich protein n=2 Tax=Ruminococcus sp. TaxID=41978 RepID=UPI002D1FAB10|nr:CPCC family cysteine-rich protein [Ruminococcus sp.]
MGRLEKQLPYRCFKKGTYMKKYRCLCCGYRTLDTRGGFDICPICFWEDEPYILYDKKNEQGHITSVYYYNDCENDDYDGSDIIDIPSGANRLLTLRQGRRNFREFGACHGELKEYVRFPRSSEMKKWRKENRIVDGELVFLSEEKG